MSIDRLARAMEVDLHIGAHNPPEGDEIRKACVMELVSYVAGEPWSDEPECACPIISAFMRTLNDHWRSIDDRNRLLRPLIPQLVGSRSTSDVEKRRSYMTLDWLVRVHTPRWLDLVPALREHAEALRALPEITSLADISAARELFIAAREAAFAVRPVGLVLDMLLTARAARRAAAGAAAQYAVRNKVPEAVREGAFYAADAAAAAADIAAAAGKDLTPTVEWLQSSALDLVRRMLEVRS